jgi:hypothetical protein
MMLTVDDLEACPGLAPTLRTLDAYARLDQAVMVRGETSTTRLLVERWAAGGRVHEIICPLVAGTAGAMHEQLREGARPVDDGGPAIVLLVEVDRLSVDDQQRALALARDRMIDLRGTKLTARLVVQFDPRFGGLRWPAGVGLEVDVPPLGARAADAVVLLPRLVGRMLGQPVALEAAAEEAVLAYGWPGDVPELVAGAARLVGAWPTDRRDPTVHAAELGIPFRPALAVRAQAQATPGRTLEVIMSEYEAEVLREVMARLGGNKSQAARELGISRSYLIQKCHRYGIE